MSTVSWTPALTVKFFEDLLELLHTEVRSIFGGSLGGGARLSTEEELALRRLRDNHCNQAFDRESPEVWRRLREIFHVGFSGETTEVADSDARWRKLGFQSNNPCSDIRAGLFALDQLHYLASTYPALLQRLVAEASHLGYPCACACFNVSQTIVLFFNLLSKPAMNPVPGAVQASCSHLKNFAHLCITCPDGEAVVLHELFCALVERLHETWKEMRTKENCSVMDFPRALKEVYVANAAFWLSCHADIAEIRELNNHLLIQVARSKSLSTVLKGHCEHMRQTLGCRIMRTKDAVGRAFHRAGASSQVSFTDMRQKLVDTRESTSMTSQVASTDMMQRLLDTHENDSNPSDIATAVMYAPGYEPAMAHGPVVRPANGLDVDAIFENLGLCDKSEKDQEPGVWDQIIALDEKLAADAAHLNILWEPCVDTGPQKVSLVPHVDMTNPRSDPKKREAVWQDFGDW